MLFSFNKFGLLFICVLVLLFAVGGVFAQDNFTDGDVVCVDCDGLGSDLLHSNFNNVSFMSDGDVLGDDGVLYVDGNNEVNGDGSLLCPFNNLKDALDKAEDGCTIMISPFIYKGSDNVDLIIDKKLSLVSVDGSNDVVFDAEHKSGIFKITTNKLNIDGLTFMNGNRTDGGALYFANGLIDSNINGKFLDNYASNRGGVIYSNGFMTNVKISGMFVNNSARNYGGVNYIAAGNNITFQGLFVNNSAVYGGVNYFWGENSNFLFDGNYSNNKARIGAVNYFRNMVNNSLFYGNYDNNCVSLNASVNYFGALNCCSISGSYRGNVGDSLIYIKGCIFNSFVRDAIFINNKGTFNNYIVFSVLYDVLIAGSGDGNNSTDNIIKIAFEDIGYNRIIENNDIVKYFRNATQYTVKVIGNDGNPVGAGESVTFDVNGVFYTRVTNGSGIAKLNLNMCPGDYIITAEYKGCKVSNTIKVLSLLSAEDLSMKYRDGSKFVTALSDGQGKPYAGQTIRFNINGVLYNRVTDSSGTAKLNINLMPGEYIITSSYNGSSIANNVTVSA